MSLSKFVFETICLIMRTQSHYYSTVTTSSSTSNLVMKLMDMLISTQILLLLICQNVGLSTSLKNLATDQSALLVLKSYVASDPRNMLRTNWTSSSSVCAWIGVTCGPKHQRITALNVSNMGLTGSIPSQLGNLSFLASLDLANNSFTGNLPRELSDLRRLKHFDLRLNNFSGEVPSWLGMLQGLERLSLRNNSFTGFIPRSLSNLTKLETLDFTFNSLQGQIPEEFGHLQSLQSLSVQYNRLSGSIPLAFYNLSSLRSIALMGNYELGGSLSDDMCRSFPFLEAIYLSLNQFSGQIPSNLSGCSNLRIISLTYNSFSGSIPSGIGMLKSLQMLYLGANNFSGVIPQEIGNLENLVGFSIESNQITGALPLTLFNITSLQRLRLSDNKLSGIIPREIGRLRQLNELLLYSNSFDGPVPSELFNISVLQLLSLRNNSLSGNLPSNFGSGLPALEELYLNNNNLTGSISDYISNCSNLRILALESNGFTGYIPRSLGHLRFLERVSLFSNNLGNDPSSLELSFITSLTNCRFLYRLAISDNPIEGVIPSSVGNFSDSFQSFAANGCKLKGSIPKEIGRLTNLMILSFYDNELTGRIPSTINNLTGLQGLSLAKNNMLGSVSRGLCHLRSLGELYLSQNRFSGPIPECLGSLTSLRILNLDSNVFTSSIPSSLWQLKELLVLNLSENSLNGFLPPEIGNLRAAVNIDLSKNLLSKDIPNSIGDLQNLYTLSLSRNRFEGSIPDTVGNMMSLTALDFSYNNLSGSIPKSLEALQHLESFNVSFNALSGEIPIDGPFRNFTYESFEGNEGLCGDPRFRVQPCLNVQKSDPEKKKLHFAFFILFGTVALAIVVVLFIFLFIRYGRKEAEKKDDEQPIQSKLERFSYHELLQATEHFDESNLLGRGSFGSVYRGVLRDGKVLAIKVFNLRSDSAFKSFDVECEVLRNLRHRNLTKVVSSCSNEDFKALILEYMPKGSLESWLYSHNYFLNLLQRFNIMVDVAMALEYLHYGYVTPIVHCDLKPSNVLLDEDTIGHVSDFGIAKLLGEEESVAFTNTIATIGYIAPEYGSQGLVSTKCDVYSYGIVLMETFTRTRPSEDMFDGDFSLKNWVERLFFESPSRVIDANLLHDEADDKKTIKCVSSVMDLALKCASESPEDRINMDEVVTGLLKIKSQFFT